MQKDLQIVGIEVEVDHVHVAVGGGGGAQELVQDLAERLYGCNGVNGCKANNNLVHQGVICNAIKCVLSLIRLKTSQSGSSKTALEALRHHVIVLSHLCLKICPPCLAEYVTVCLEGGFVDLAIALDNANINASGILELGDALGTQVPSYDGAAVFKDLDKCGSQHRGHEEPLDHGELLASLSVNVPT
jgi:hypothetical protein